MIFQKWLPVVCSLFLGVSAVAHADANFEILDQPLDNNHGYYVFLNLNISPIELSHYRHYARTRGYGMVMIPNMATLREMSGNNAAFINKRCADIPSPIPEGMHSPHSPSSSCKIIDDALINSAEHHPIDVKRDLTAAFTAISEQHGQVRSMMFSGHNSSGGFSGDYLSSQETFKHVWAAELIKAQTLLDKNLFSKMTSLALWGCDSVTQSETKYFRNVVPSLSYIIGYGDSAPAGIRPVSGSYLESALLHEDAVVASHNRSELLGRINAIGITGVWAGLWVRTLSDGDYLYRRAERGVSLTRVTEVCDQFLDQRFAREKQIMRQYYSGEKQIPVKDDPSSTLRSIYYDLTTYSDCYTHSPEINDVDPMSFIAPTQVGLLRFFTGVKENFVDVFAPYMRSGMRETILNASRQDLISLVSSLKAGDPESRKLSMYIDRYLVKVDDSCMDFLVWHEKKPGRPPSHQCVVKDDFTWNM